MSRRLDLLTGAVAVVFIVVAVLISLNLVALRNDMRTDQRRAVPALLATERLMVSLVDQETGVRGFLLGRTRDLLEPYESGRTAQAAQQVRLHDLLTGDRSGSRLMSRLDSAVSTWRAWAARSVTDAERSPRPSSAKQRAQMAESKVLFDTIRSRQGALSTYLQGKAEHARDRADGARTQLQWLFVVSLIVIVALLVLTRFLFGRWVSRPLADIRRRVAAVPASGESTSLPFGGPAEISSLTREIDLLRSRLRNQLLETERAVDALRQRGPAVLSLRDELKPRLPSIPGLALGSEFEPAEGVLAGDWGDIVDLGDGRWGLLLLDVSGHGAPAGILALQLKQTFIPALREGRRPHEVFEWTIESIDDWGERFATAVIIAGRCDSPVLEYANAGHPEPLLCRTGKVLRLPPTGPLLTDATRHLGWRTEQVSLDVGDRLVAYTDGIPEARSDAGEQFGVLRLQEHVCDGRPPRESVREALAAVRRHQSVRQDDATLIVLDRVALTACRPPEKDS